MSKAGLKKTKSTDTGFGKLSQTFIPSSDQNITTDNDEAAQLSDVSHQGNNSIISR